MAPTKRPASQPSTPRKKKSNNQNQLSLSSFFASPSSKDKEPQTLSVEEVPRPFQDDLSLLTQEERDAKFAMELAAEQEGISLDEHQRRLRDDEEMARRLDREWRQEQGANIAKDLSASSSSAVKLETADKVANNSSSQAIDPPKPVGNGTSQSKASSSKIVDLEALDASIRSIDLSQDILTFDPHAVDTSFWPTIVSKDGGGTIITTPYALLTHAFVLISATRSRLAITTLLTNLLRVIRAHDPESLLPSVYLISNHIAPAYDGVELGIGGSIVSRAVKEVTGKSARHLKSLWDKTGDPGDVAYEAKKDVKALVKPSPITVQKLFATLHTIARMSGQGSAAQKLGHVTKLLVASRGEETRFLVRTFHSHLRIQAVRTTIATALARVFALVEQSDVQPTYERPKDQERASLLLVTPEERKGVLANPTKAKDKADPKRLLIMEKLTRAEKLVREVRARHPNFSAIVPALLSVGLPGLSEHVPLRIGTPISPMLGSITRSLAAMHTKLGPRAFVSEFKYDGQRCQIHAIYVPRSAGAEARKSIVESHNRAAANNGKCGKWVGKHGEVYVRLFSRHLEEMTEKYPDITDMIPVLMGLESEAESQGSGNAASKEIDVASMENHISQVADVESPSDAAKGDEIPLGEDGKITSFIMDAEVVAMGLDGELLPFQTLSNRSRKDVNLHDIKVKVGVFAFDLMYLDGQSLLKSSFRKRRTLLHTKFKPLSPRSPLIARFAHVRSCESTDPDEVAKFFQAAQEHKCEGIMVKSLDHHWETAPVVADHDKGNEARSEKSDEPIKVTTKEDEEDEDEAAPVGRLEKLGDEIEDDLAVSDDDDGRDGALSATSTQVGKGVNGRGKALLSTYEPDKRCESWLKVKKDYVDGLGDSLDLVPIGAWHGMGRKASWWSPILLALYDPDTGVFQAVCKCISGFTDAFYKELNVRYAEGSETCVPARNGEPPPGGYEFDTGNLLPDVWWKPSEVWELRGADITVSPNYTAAIGLVNEERGLSIRFPRFMKTREDKSIEQASTPSQLAEMYRQQQRSGPKVEVGDAEPIMEEDLAM